VSDDEAEVLLQTLKGEAQTLVRSPSSTVAPPQDGLIGRRALEILKGLVFDPKALVDEAPLGEGGMGVVRLAKQVALDRHVAVKFLRPEHRAPSDVEALLSEAWLAGALEHPNILPVYSVGLDAQGLPVIVMKRIEGRTWSTLRTRLARRRSTSTCACCCRSATRCTSRTRAAWCTATSSRTT
jgi:serine/threonine-protein kinase